MESVKRCPSCKMEKPLTEFYLVKGKAYPYCKPCVKVKGLKYRAANEEKCKARAKRWQLSNPDKVRESSARARKRNREKTNEATRKWYHANKDSRKLSIRDWTEKNIEKRRQIWARHKASKMGATPDWADHNAIDMMYIAARLCTESTGIEYHVDHIVPLQSELVCGLHVSDNLQVITGAENCSKRNYHWPDMPR